MERQNKRYRAKRLGTFQKRGFGVIQSYDVGSLPFFGDLNDFVRSADSFEAGVRDEGAASFERKVLKVFSDKLAVGIDLPNFPQFRDMNEMFLGMIAGVERLKEGYVETERLTLKRGKGCLPEVLAIKRNAADISERFGKPFSVKICVTGPYTLTSFFPYRTSETFSRLGGVVSRIVDANVFCEKVGCVGLVSVDEPLFGLVDEPLIDSGSSGRENLLKAWEDVFKVAKSKKARTCLHLHSTSDELFWTAESLDVVESHVGDPLYVLDETKKRLEIADKVLKASVCVTDFDVLIRENLKTSRGLSGLALDEAVAEVWRKLRKNAIAPESFLESLSVMKKRAEEIIAKFGVEKVPYIGPECGLRGFPTYESAVECLRRVAGVAKSFA
jgi:5-methyltetrahydropteroyltriglutamate--homocysteine methyltransferase